MLKELKEEEFARRGDEIYKTQVRPQVEKDIYGKIVAIDIETGDFEVDKHDMAACDRLETRRPDAQIWIVRIGSRHVRRLRSIARGSTSASSFTCRIPALLLKTWNCC